jgi:nuclear pore complex protein Nup133
MGLKEGRFSRFVFEQCYQQGQHARLLRLGEEFGEELAVFLEEHPELLWVHQLKLHQFTAASKTLFLVSQHSTNSTIRERRHLLQLAKLAALAGGAVGADEIAQNVDANVAILAVQV